MNDEYGPEELSPLAKVVDRVERLEAEIQDLKRRLEGLDAASDGRARTLANMQDRIESLEAAVLRLAAEPQHVSKTTAREVIPTTGPPTLTVTSEQRSTVEYPDCHGLGHKKWDTHRVAGYDACGTCQGTGRVKA